MSTSTRPAFDELAALEPRLAALLAEAQGYHATRPRGFCANAVFYGYPGHRPGLKRRLSELVGHVSDREGVLGTSDAYDVAYHTVYQALPDCKHRGSAARSPGRLRSVPTDRSADSLPQPRVGRGRERSRAGAMPRPRLFSPAELDTIADLYFHKQSLIRSVCRCPRGPKGGGDAAR